jgi:type II secretory pathway component PulM
MAALDKLRDKWQSISPREQRMVVLLGVSTVLILIIYVSLQIREGLVALEAKNARSRRALKALTEYKAQAHAVTADDPSKLIGPEPIKLETYLYRAAEKAQVTVPGVNARGAGTAKGSFTPHSATVEIRELSITQIKDFLEAIETESKIVVVSSLQIRRNFRDKEKLDLNIEVTTWSKAAAAEGEGEGKGKGSGSSSGTAKGGG